MVGTANHGAAHDTLEPQLLCGGSVGFELLRRDVLRDGDVPLRRPQILPDGQGIAGVVQRIAHQRKDLLGAFSEAGHDPGLDHRLRPDALGVGEDPEAPLIPGFGTDLRIEPWHRFQIVSQHVGTGVKNHLERFRIPLQIRNQKFDGTIRDRRPDRPGYRRKMGGTAIRQIIPRDGGNHRVLQLKAAHRLRHVAGFLQIHGLRALLRHVAETAVSGAVFAENHEGRGPMPKALAPIRAVGLAAHGIEGEALGEFFHGLNVCLAVFRMNPRRLAFDHGCQFPRFRVKCHLYRG